MSKRRPQSETELVELIHSIDARAPESLHRRVDTLIAHRSAGARRRDARERAPRAFGLRPRLAAGGAILATVLALVIVIGLSGGSSTLSVHDASALALRAATAAAPSESTTAHTELAAAVDGVSFPYWGNHFGWRSTGSRVDHLDGRTITTVFYEHGRGRRVGYSIVAGGNAPSLTGGVVSRHDGTSYRLVDVNGAPVVAWLREGHLCIVSGRGVAGETLLRLASWDEHRSVTS